MAKTADLSIDEARRIALAAQGFADACPQGRVDIRALRRVIDRVGLFQIDSVNVLVRAHDMPLYSRLGAYPRSLLDDAVYKRRELFEAWAHVAFPCACRLLPAAKAPEAFQRAPVAPLSELGIGQQGVRGCSAGGGQGARPALREGARRSGLAPWELVDAVEGEAGSGVALPLREPDGVRPAKFRTRLRCDRARVASRHPGTRAGAGTRSAA